MEYLNLGNTLRGERARLKIMGRIKGSETYTKAFKGKMIKEMLEGKQTPSQLAKRYDIKLGTLSGWKSAALRAAKPLTAAPTMPEVVKEVAPVPTPTTTLFRPARDNPLGMWVYVRWSAESGEWVAVHDDSEYPVPPTINAIFDSQCAALLEAARNIDYSLSQPSQEDLAKISRLSNPERRRV